jgi:hypothetical protein
MTTTASVTNYQQSPFSTNKTPSLSTIRELDNIEIEQVSGGVFICWAIRRSWGVELHCDVHAPELGPVIA